MNKRKHITLLRFAIPILTVILLLGVGAGLFFLTAQRQHNKTHAAGALVCADGSTPDATGVCADGSQAQVVDDGNQGDTAAQANNGDTQNQGTPQNQNLVCVDGSTPDATSVCADGSQAQPANGTAQNQGNTGQTTQDGQTMDCTNGMQLTQNDINIVGDHLLQDGYDQNDLPVYQNNPCAAFDTQDLTENQDTSDPSPTAQGAIQNNTPGSLLSGFSPLAARFTHSRAAGSTCTQVNTYAVQVDGMDINIPLINLPISKKHVLTRMILNVHFCYDGQIVTQVDAQSPAFVSTEGNDAGWTCTQVQPAVKQFAADKSSFQITVQANCNLPSPGSGTAGVNVGVGGGAVPASGGVSFGVTRTMPGKTWIPTLTTIVKGDGSDIHTGTLIPAGTDPTGKVPGQ